MFKSSSSQERKNSQYFEKNKRAIENCEICTKQFKQIISRKHKCKRCKRYICSNCGSQKTIIIGIDLEKEKPHRTCDLCIVDIHNIQEFIDQYSLKWNSNSLISANWSKFIKSKSISSHNFHQYLEIFERNSSLYQDDYDIVIKDIDEGRTHYSIWNFSMRTFLYLLQSSFQKDEINFPIKRVLKAIIIRYPEIGYCQGMNYIVTFLLCIANDELSFLIFCHLIDNILPSKFFHGSHKGTALLGIFAEKFIVTKLLEELLKKEELMNAEQFLNVKIAQWLLCLMVNVLDLKTTFYLWEKMICENSFIQFEKTCVMIIINQLKNFQDPGFDTYMLNDSITREINLDIIKNNHKINIDESYRNYLHGQYLKEFSDKWNNDDIFTHKQLEKITHFSKIEIKEIQEKFLIFIDKEKNNGISKDNFCKIVKSLQSEKYNKVKSFLSLNKEDCDNIFKLFDDDNSDSLDFREFLCCISLLMRGDIAEKMDLCFNLFDKNKKNYLISEEFERFLNTFYKSLKISYFNDVNNVKEFQEFRKRVSNIFQNTGKFLHSDLVFIIKDEFIIDLSNYYRNLERRNTSKNLADTLNIGNLNKLN